MPRPAIGSVKVGYSGTHDQALKFIKEVSNMFPIPLTRGLAGREKMPNGDQVVLAKFRNMAELEIIQQKFSELGWSAEVQAVRRYMTGNKQLLRSKDARVDWTDVVVSNQRGDSNKM